MKNRALILVVAAVVVLAAGLFLTLRRSAQQADLGGTLVFPKLEAELGKLDEIHFSKGDGSSTTLRKTDAGWTVVERQFPADAQRVRELALNLARLRVVERKTADPANYARLGVEDPDSPAATGTLLEVKAGAQSWQLIVGKNAENRALYVRHPGQAPSLLAAPFFSADPDQKRWIDRQLTDIAGKDVHDVAVKPARGPAYQLTRATRGAPEVTLSPVAKGRTAASNMILSGQTEALVAFNFDDVRAADANAAAADVATYRTFDGQVIEFTGRREADKAYVRVRASRDETLAKQFAEPPPAPPAPGEPVVPAADAPKPAEPDHTAERLAARSDGVEFEIPVYKYEALFKPYEELLEPKK